MATISELKDGKQKLESRGVMGQLKARIRAEVFSALDEQREARPSLSHENLLINELIREYLEFNKYRHTASVLTAANCVKINLTCSDFTPVSYFSPMFAFTESGQPETPLDRQFLAAELRVSEDANSKSV
uniref:Centrosomal protein 20 n=1 Tax=Poecilia reticulata TaxID=8081 RepID=A0A3P9MTN4_POERE